MEERNSGSSNDEEVKVKETRIVCYAYDACKWFQQVLSKCLGLGLDSPSTSTCSHDHKNNKQGSSSGAGGDHADPPPSTDVTSDPPLPEQEALERSRRMPPRPPVSSGGGGKTN